MDGTARVGLASASARLPARQREVLELHELHGRSYEAIAAELDTSWACVAQLIAHARINLYDEIHGTILASVAPSAECERALPLIAARQDDELGSVSADSTWLDAHIADCSRCRRGVEEMAAAAGVYRDDPAGGSRQRLPRRTLAVGIALGLLGLTGIATALVANDPAPTPGAPAAGAAASLAGESGRADGGKPVKPYATARNRRAPIETRRQTGGSAGQESATAGTTTAGYVPEAARGPASNPTPAPAPSGGGAQNSPSPDASRPSAGAVVQRPKPASRPAPTPTPSAAPAPAPAPEPPPSDQHPEQSNKPAEPPGQSGVHPKK